MNQNQISRTNKNDAIVLKRLVSVGQHTVAAALGVHESTISRLKETDIHKFAGVLAILELKIVPESHHCMDKHKLEWLLEAAKFGINHLKTPDDFLEDDAE